MEALVRWLVLDQQAFLTVDSGAFRHLISQLDPRFRVPFRQTITNQIISEFGARSEQLKGHFTRQNGKVSITTDIWTACNEQAFLGIVVHWIDLDWKMRVLLLDIVPLHDSHTGTLIATTIIDVLRSFGLGERLLDVPTDNGGNMVTLAEKLSMQYANQRI